VANVGGVARDVGVDASSGQRGGSSVAGIVGASVVVVTEVARERSEGTSVGRVASISGAGVAVITRWVLSVLARGVRDVSGVGASISGAGVAVIALGVVEARRDGRAQVGESDISGGSVTNVLCASCVWVDRVGSNGTCRSWVTCVGIAHVRSSAVRSGGR